MSDEYAGGQIVGIDLHRRRSVLVRMTEAGERLETTQISNDPGYLGQVMAQWPCVNAHHKPSTCANITQKPHEGA